MKSILMSIQPKWCELIAIGQKTIEVRKTAPKEVPFKVYIYCTLPKGKVIGEFICDKVDKVINHGSGFSIFNESEAYTNHVARQSGLDFDDLKKYLETKDGYAWHITDLKVYDKPKELKEFRKVGCEYCKDIWGDSDGRCTRAECTQIITRPPESYMFVESPDWAEAERQEVEK